MENNKEQQDVTKIPKKEVQKTPSMEKVIQAEKEEGVNVITNKEKQTSQNQLR